MFTWLRLGCNVKVVNVISAKMRRMNVFLKRFNPMTGTNEWTMQNEDYDYVQEIARSSYADMLHDKERNVKYYSAIKRAVETVKSQGKCAKVLDIGTGTGLLSLMAVCCGADSVVACEAFYPIAKCAEQVIKDNGFDEKIKVIPKRSTELTVGPDEDIPEKANILVAEVFDTELIGEGALGTFSHALKYLLEDDAIVVPSSAVVYGQVVQSEMILRWNKFHPIYLDKNHVIYPPHNIETCSGSASLHDLQLNQISIQDFIPVTQPVEIFRFDFTGKTKLQTNEETHIEVDALIDGQCHVVFMWWELQMDMLGKIILSCAPYWAHPSPSEMQWRDHWMQAIYYLPDTLDVQKNEKIVLHSYHDEYSLWFDIYRTGDCKDHLPILRPVCMCGAHITYSRTRLAMLNDINLNQLHVTILKKILTPESHCLCISDGSLLPLMIAVLGAKKVYTVESEYLNSNVVKLYIEANSLSDKVVVIEKNVTDLTKEDLDGKEVDILIGEPYFNSSILPWDNLHFWYMHSSIQHLLCPSTIVLPGKATIKGVAVEFKDLHKIRAPVVSAEGFNLFSFDKLIQEAIDIADDPVEQHLLWEYPCVALSSCYEMMTFDMTVPIGSTAQETTGYFNLQTCGTCNGVAMWIEYEMNGTMFTSNGPAVKVTPGEQILWNKISKQGVHFLMTPIVIQKDKKQYLKYSVSFNPTVGNMAFNFSLIKNVKS